MRLDYCAKRKIHNGSCFTFNLLELSRIVERAALRVMPALMRLATSVGMKAGARHLSRFDYGKPRLCAP